MNEDNLIVGTNILIYNPNTMTYVTGHLDSYEYRCGICGDSNLQFSISNIEKLESIELDSTTMKRIAKYNKETECKKLDTEIKKQKEKIKELDDKLKDKEKRWKKVKNYIANIYEIDIDDYEEENYD